MTLLRRPAPRFALWALLLIGIAAATGVAGLSPWIIAGLEFGVWVVVAASERTLSGPWTSPTREAPSAPLPRPVTPRQPEALAPPPPPPPPPAPAVARSAPPAAAPQAAPQKPTEWNVWT